MLTFASLCSYLQPLSGFVHISIDCNSSENEMFGNVPNLLELQTLHKIHFYQCYRSLT